jgi:hypothetical protein
MFNSQKETPANGGGERKRERSRGFNRVLRAIAGASAAINAFPRVDHILRVAFTNRFHRTTALTRAAHHAGIANHISHNFLLSRLKKTTSRF